MNHSIDTWIDMHEDEIIDMAKFLFDHPELAYQEYESSKYIASYLEKEGFEVSCHTAGIETAFTASFGSGRPVIGLLAEYDALPNLGQAAVCTHHPAGTNGHGCGHNLFGSAVAAAACALKAEVVKNGLPGTIRVYGCPAEETMSGKIVMNQHGVFDDLDAAVTWHPFDRNRVSNDIWLSQDIKNYKFYGTSAHAAKNPELGRSALDAAELMNVGVNYLREHVSGDVRMHYAYRDNGQPANVVPDYAETNYFIRSSRRSRTEDASRRIDDCAKGAALMTGTRVEIELVASCREMKVNRTLAQVFYKAMQDVPVPEYTDEELSFAARITEEAGLRNNGVYFTGLEPLEDEPVILPIGTDVSDISHTVPTVTISAATMCKGTPLHHWSTTAQSGMSIGFKGMLYAAKCMAHGSRMLLECPDYLDKARQEFLIGDGGK